MDIMEILFAIVLILMLLMLSGPLILQHIRDAWAAHKTKRFIKKHRTTVIGEIIGREYEGRYAVIPYFIERRYRRHRRLDNYYVYSAKVCYTIGDCTYRIAANDYKLDMPIVGQKVYVHYNPNDPTQMRVGAMVEDGVIRVGRQPLRLIAMWKMRKYQTEVVGEVVGFRQKDYRCKALVPWVGCLTDEVLYSSVIRYQVFNTVYEIDAGDYSDAKPVLGYKALVFCNSWHPEKAIVPAWRNSQDNIEVIDCDEEYVYCLCNYSKRIKVPITRVEEGVKTGRYLIYWYGFYQLE